ncbi:MAG: type II toxin-antitoxin system RelE/ParE family toxin [Pseudomonadota bacterium]
MAYEIEFDPEAVKDLKKLDRPVQQRLLGFLKLRVAVLENPRDIGEALAGSRLGQYWKYRVGDWRIICEIQDERVVVRVLRLGNRREIYRK